MLVFPSCSCEADVSHQPKCYSGSDIRTLEGLHCERGFFDMIPENREFSRKKGVSCVSLLERKKNPTADELGRALPRFY